MKTYTHSVPVIVNELPPNFEQIRAAFPRAESPGVLFAFDGHIYNPSGFVVPPALLAHEEVHLHRQRNAGPHPNSVTQWSGAELWWQRYLEDSEFRYNEELLAHVAELKHQKHSDRNASARLLLATALRLVAPLYNYVPPVTLRQAMQDLKREIAK
jgi:hypothetical protein